MNEQWVQGSAFLTAPSGFNIQFRRQADGRVVATCRLDQRAEGPPGLVHGGMLASLIDEAMGAAAWLAGYPVLAANLTVDFRRPAPLGENLIVSGWVESAEGRKIRARGAVHRADGILAAEATGLYIAAPGHFEQPGLSLSP